MEDKEDEKTEDDDYSGKEYPEEFFTELCNLTSPLKQQS
jgi:hypothetical protein